MGLSCDLFCRVVDNLGDAGVCWRLARQLAKEHGWAVRLWIDDPVPLADLRPGIDPERDVQQVDGVEIRHWPADFSGVHPGQVVIESFACELPAAFVEAMASQPKAPVWINLEYLSAEDWVAGCHGLPSPHPTLPLLKHFFFPGFAPGTGGLIRARDLPDPPLRNIGAELVVSLFCYDNPALPALLQAWAEGDEPVSCRVAEGAARQQVQHWLGRNFPVNATVRRGSLELIAEPFVAQTEYDRRLVDSDLNFVRGEDSFVRAQWAQRPFVWQAYPQEDGAHFVKLEAFLTRYTTGLNGDPQTRNALTNFWMAWNGRGGIGETWPAFRGVLPRLTFHGPRWAKEIAKPGNLEQNLVCFCRERL